MCKQKIIKCFAGIIIIAMAMFSGYATAGGCVCGGDFPYCNTCPGM